MSKAHQPFSPCRRLATHHANGADVISFELFSSRFRRFAFCYRNNRTTAEVLLCQMTTRSTPPLSLIFDSDDPLLSSFCHSSYMYPLSTTVTCPLDVSSCQPKHIQQYEVAETKQRRDEAAQPYECSHFLRYLYMYLWRFGGSFCKSSRRRRRRRRNTCICRPAA